MLEKNNFKERLRKMEEQNKRERFSIRKLSVGAASVLIGFAFMGLSSSTALADPLVPASEPQTAKSETNNQGNDAAAEKPQLADSGKQNNDQTSMDAQSGKQESQAPAATEQKQNEQSAQPDQAEKFKSSQSKSSRTRLFQHKSQLLLPRLRKTSLP